MKHMNQLWLVRSLLALTLLVTLGVVTIVTAPQASAHSLTCGNFTTVLHRTNLVANGVTIGYGETLTDGCDSYDLHGHLSAMPAGSVGHRSYLGLSEGSGGFIMYSGYFKKAPQDFYFNVGSSNSFSPTSTKTDFSFTDDVTKVIYRSGDFQHLVCNNFTTVVKHSNLVANGVTIGYAELLTNGCTQYKVNGHLSAMPAGSVGHKSYLLLEEGDAFSGSDFFTTAPQDTSITLPGDFPKAPQTDFSFNDFDTQVVYQVTV